MQVSAPAHFEWQLSHSALSISAWHATLSAGVAFLSHWHESSHGSGAVVSAFAVAAALGGEVGSGALGGEVGSGALGEEVAPVWTVQTPATQLHAGATQAISVCRAEQSSEAFGWDIS